MRSMTSVQPGKWMTGGVMQISSEPWFLIVVNEAQNRG